MYVLCLGKEYYHGGIKGEYVHDIKDAAKFPDKDVALIYAKGIKADVLEINENGQFTGKVVTAKKTVPILLAPQWNLVNGKYVQVDTLTLECVDKGKYFSITKPLPGSLHYRQFKYVITHNAVGMICWGFNELNKARKCVKQYEQGESNLVGLPSGYESWSRIDTPELLMQQHVWMREVIKGLSNE